MSLSKNLELLCESFLRTKSAEEGRLACNLQYNEQVRVWSHLSGRAKLVGYLAEAEISLLKIFSTAYSTSDVAVMDHLMTCGGKTLRSWWHCVGVLSYSLGWQLCSKPQLCYNLKFFPIPELKFLPPTYWCYYTFNRTNIKSQSLKSQRANSLFLTFIQICRFRSQGETKWGNIPKFPKHFCLFHNNQLIHVVQQDKAKKVHWAGATKKDGPKFSTRFEGQT